MKVNREYLNEYCKHNEINFKGQLSLKKISKIAKDFGVNKKLLKFPRDLNELERIINQYGKIPSNSDLEINSEYISCLQLIFYK